MSLPGLPSLKAVTQSEIAGVLSSCRNAFISIALFSGMSNILMLTGAIFMLEIYDRVLPSRSVPTLVALIIIATALYGALGILDLIRSRILVRIGSYLDESISERVYDGLVQLPLKAGNRGEGLQSLRDLDNLRVFSVRIGTYCTIRSALDSALSHHLFCLSLSDWTNSSDRRNCLVHTDCVDRGLHARSWKAFGRTCDCAKRPCRVQPTQCRSAGRDGYGAAAGITLEGRRTKNISRASVKRATSP